MTQIKNFTIMGERCSGTNYLEQLVSDNFEIAVTWKYGWKHFFGFYDFNNLKDEDENETLFIGIVRHPVEWIDSFFKYQHHIKNAPLPIEEFISKPIVSTNEGKIIEEDTNYLTKKPYKNIFELRFLKNYYLINIMPTKVKNYVLIQYETLRDNPNMILEMLERKFNLNKKYEIFKNINYYKDDKNREYKKQNITISNSYALIILNNVNKIQENKLGYKI